MSTHRTLAGGWAECPAPEDCALLFHLELSVAEAEAMPLSVLVPLLNVIDPPHAINEKGLQQWLDEEGQTHREYDLPALIRPNGGMSWRWHGVPHREDDKPSDVNPGGVLQWMYHGDPKRRSGGPSAILPDGTQYWLDGAYGNKFHREGGLPALIRPDGSMELWERGVRLRRIR